MGSGLPLPTAYCLLPTAYCLLPTAQAAHAPRTATPVKQPRQRPTTGSRNAAISDELHGRDFDWLWVLHPVDSQPPGAVSIDAPITYVRSGVNFILGSVADDSGADEIEIEITPLPAGAPITLNCADPTPEDGAWTCLWDPGDLAGLAGFDLRARATDLYGNTGGWKAELGDLERYAASVTV